MGARFLILAPHPDDEVVGCAIAARRAMAAGAQAFVLYLTTGVPPQDRLWPWARRGHHARVGRRRSEALDAAALLGFEPVGFQDWPGRSLKTRFDAACRLIAATIDRHSIDALWVPAYEGGHQDHDAANLLAARFAGRLPVIEFAEYHAAHGATRAQEFIAANGTEQCVLLTPEERRLKRRALALYRSERANLRHVAIEQEQLRPLARYDYRAPPHPGRPFWARHQWVPFRHPRIDFEPPERVYSVLAAFAQASADRPRPEAAPSGL